MSIPATYVSATQFTVDTDQTGLFVANRKVKLDCNVDGYVYGTIASSSFAASKTTVTIDESVITSNLRGVLVGAITSGVNGSLPDHNHDMTITDTVEIVSNGNGSTNDNIDVSGGVGTIIANTAGGNVIVGGLSGGSIGQWVIILKSSVKNILIVEHTEGVGDEDINTPRNLDMYINPRGGIILEFDGTAWNVISSTHIGKNFYVDHTNADQSAASSTGKGLTLYDIQQLMAVDDEFTVIFEDHTAEYHFKSDLDMSAFEKVKYAFKPGAVFTRENDAVVTFYSSVQLDFIPRRSIGPVGMFAFANDIMRYGEVDVFPWVSSDVSNVRLPSGLWADVSSSQTQGLQEAVDYAFGDGTPGTATYNLEIAGKQKDEGGAFVFYLNQTLSFPPMRQTTFRTGGITLTYSGAPVTPLMEFDSLFQCTIDLNFEFDSAANGPIILFKPQTAPPDAPTGVLESDIKMGTVAQTGNPPSAYPMVVLDGTDGYLGTSTYKINEINGLSNSNTTGFAITNCNSYWCYNNHFIFPHMHAFGQAGLQVGDSGSNPSLITNNKFDCGLYSYNMGVGVDCYGVRNTFELNAFFDTAEIKLTTDIKWRESAQNNIVMTSKYSTLVDSSDGSNRIITSSGDTYTDTYFTLRPSPLTITNSGNGGINDAIPLSDNGGVIYANTSVGSVSIGGFETPPYNGFDVNIFKVNSANSVTLVNSGGSNITMGIGLDSKNLRYVNSMWYVIA